MLRHVPRGRSGQPLLETKVLELRCLEYLQESQLFISNVLDVVSHALKYIVEVSMHAVKSTRRVG